LSLAAVNSVQHCVVSGAIAEIDAFEARLAAEAVSGRRLYTSHAFHSAAMDAIVDAFAAEVRKAKPAAPTIPFVSNVSGDWITGEQAIDPQYWARHLRETVRFAEGVGRLLEDPQRILLEVGPGETLGTFARRHPAHEVNRPIVHSLARADRPERSDLTLLDAAGALWTAGVPIDWSSVRGGEPRRRVPLPTYPFERTEYRVPRPSARSHALPTSRPAAALASIPATDLIVMPPVPPLPEGSDIPDTSELHEVVAQQLAIMQAQLELLRDAAEPEGEAFLTQ
jgi:acyl transferase domain-containing protein